MQEAGIETYLPKIGSVTSNRDFLVDFSTALAIMSAVSYGLTATRFSLFRCYQNVTGNTYNW
jgi:hypothetical protein